MLPFVKLLSLGTWILRSEQALPASVVIPSVLAVRLVSLPAWPTATWAAPGVEGCIPPTVTALHS